MLAQCNDLGSVQILIALFSVMSMSWCYSSFSLQKKKTTTTTTTHIAVQKKNGGNVSLIWSLPFLSYHSLSSHTSNVFFADCLRIVRAATVSAVTFPGKFYISAWWKPDSAYSGTNWSQFEKDHPNLKTFPAHLVTYNLKMTYCAYKLWGAMKKIS